MLFLIDGYNVTHADPATQDLPIEEQRDALVRRLRARGRDLLGAGRIVVVFDGAGGTGGGISDAAPVEVVYARSGSADDEIVRVASSAREAVSVVTDDRGLIERVRAHASGAVQVLATARCFEEANAAPRSRKRSRTPRDAGLPAGAHEITRELKGLWLPEDER